MDHLSEQQMRDFGRWVKQKREELHPKVSQTKAAQIAGISRSQWARIEIGTSGTKRENIPWIAKALKVNVREVYERAGFAPPLQLVDDPDFEESNFRALYRKFVLLTAPGMPEEVRLEADFAIRQFERELDRLAATASPARSARSGQKITVPRVQAGQKKMKDKRRRGNR